MIGRTLWRYLFRRYLVVTGWFVLGMIGLIFLVDFTEFASRTSGHENYTVALGIKLSILRLPGIIQVTAPFVILFSAMSLLLMLNRRYELVVARSTGVSAWQFLSPLCVASLLMGIFLITTINPLSARALSIVHEYEVALGCQFACDVRLGDNGHRRGDIQHVDSTTPIDHAVDDFGAERVLGPPFGIDRYNVEVRYQGQGWSSRI